MLNQLVSLRWQHLDVKWMDGVVKRRHRKYASLHSLLDCISHGSTEQIHSDTVSCIPLDKIPSRTNRVYHRTLDLTRNVASISAWPAAIEGAANTFLLSFRIISCAAHLKSKRSRHRWAHLFENTFHSNHDARYGWLTSKFVRPEIQTSSRDMASKSSSWFISKPGSPQLLNSLGILHVSIQLVQTTKQGLVWTFYHAIAVEADIFSQTFSKMQLSRDPLKQ